MTREKENAQCTESPEGHGKQGLNVNGAAQAAGRKLGQVEAGSHGWGITREMTTTEEFKPGARV